MGLVPSRVDAKQSNPSLAPSETHYAAVRNLGAASWDARFNADFGMRIAADPATRP